MLLKEVLKDHQLLLQGTGALLVSLCDAFDKIRGAGHEGRRETAHEPCQAHLRQGQLVVRGGGLTQHEARHFFVGKEKDRIHEPDL